ncbi:MAG: Ldh family oxidoreductase [Armatimonadota bacterium]|nr:Ldh family oxidoreductase [Armatimonadota bacterium]
MRVPNAISHTALREFCTRVLEAAGAPAEHARITAEILVEADLRGIHSHGVSLLPTYVRRLRSGLTNPTPAIITVRSHGATALLDGDFGLGYVLGHTAMTTAIAKARQYGVGIVGVRRSTHYGMAGYYAMMAADARMVGYTTSNAGADMVPWQGARPALGNNPLAYAIPAGRHAAIVLDMACSVVARGRIRIAGLRGERIPHGWVLGDIEDPRDAYAAPLAPFGTYKGSGLAIVNEVLSAIVPAARLSIEIARTAPVCGEARDPRGIGHLFMALDIAVFQPLDEFLGRVDALIDSIKATPPAEGCNEVLVPGEPEHRTRLKALREGIALHPALLDLLRPLSLEMDIPFL